MGVDARKFPRRRVHIRVMYKRGDKLVEKYAENLSAGGLFINHAQDLVLKEMVQIEIELPKHGTYRVNADVMHATRDGAGLQLKSPPTVFKQELERYLKRLEGRPSAKVFVDSDPWRALLAEAGYGVHPLPLPSEVIALVGDATAIGLMAPEETADQYRNALAFLGEDSSLVIAINPQTPVEPVLAWLDDKLLRNTSMTAPES